VHQRRGATRHPWRGENLGRRKAESRTATKPEVAQMPADEGLFGDRAYKSDLFDLTRRQKVAKP